MEWTDEEIGEEWRYRYLERLGMLCGEAKPTDEELAMAIAEATAVVNQLKGQDDTRTSKRKDD